METIVNIPRDKYIDKIRPYIGKNIVKVLTGQRRVGKSYILKYIEKIIRDSETDANIIYINLEDFAFAHIDNAETLNKEISKNLSDEKRNYIFIDEVQEVADFEKVLRSLSLNPSNDIYVTGSNSSMLSSEIGSRLAGRSMEFHVHPLSYSEFLIFHSLEDSDESLELFLQFGGMPYLRNLPLYSTWFEYLAAVSDAIIYRDIVTRYSVRNNDFLQRLILFLADNIGRIFTSKKISDYLKSQRVGGTVTSVQTYADYFCDAFLINKVRRWDIEGKRFFEIGEKYFFEDVGIRNSIIGYRPGDKSGIMENVVFNKLKFDGFEVKVGSLSDGKEIDFIAEKDGERKYIQVSLNIDSEATAQRELGNLSKIADNYEKILVTLKDSTPNTFRGIKMMSLREFLIKYQG